MENEVNDMSLIDIFGDSKVLDFFRLHQYWDYSIKDVSEATEVSYRTLQMTIPRLVKKGFLIYTRTEGKAKMYQFNAKSEVAKRLDQFARDMDFEMARTKRKIAV